MQANQIKMLVVTWEVNSPTIFLIDKQIIYTLFRRTSGLSFRQMDSMRNSEQSF